MSDEVTQDMRLDEYWSPEHFGTRQSVELTLTDFNTDWDQVIRIINDPDGYNPERILKGISKVMIADVPYARSVSDMVAEFTKGNKTGSDLWIDLIWEEAQELFEAYDDYTRDGKDAKDAESTLKEMADLVYVVHGLANELGWDLDEAIKRVHASNMSKLDDNGEPIYNEAGKRLKGKNYKAPDLKDLV